MQKRVLNIEINFYCDQSETTNLSCLERFVALESDAGEFHEAMNTLNMGNGDIKSTLRVISINLHFRNKKFKKHESNQKMYSMLLIQVQVRFYQDSFFWIVISQLFYFYVAYFL